MTARSSWRDSQNMEECRDIKRWAWYMKRTRERNGHDKASRKGKDGKEAVNTILYHQILGFNPDECDVNGGKLSPEDCMRYAKEYIGTYYPNQEVVLALHNEYCKGGRHPQVRRPHGHQPDGPGNEEAPRRGTRREREAAQGQSASGRWTSAGDSRPWSATRAT